VTAPAPSDDLVHGDYHGHPSYRKVWLWLVALLAVSLALAALDNHRLAVALVFGLAVVKALLVLGNFMHLRWEPRLVWLVAGFGVLCIVFLYFGVLPDIVLVKPSLAR
jgi:caa(3)-type oxidase subunit IV